MKRRNLIVTILVLVTISLAIVRTYVANGIATSGVVLSDLEQKTSELEKQNAVLSEKLYSEASLSSIELKASKLGYLPNKNSLAISSNLPVAYKK